MQRLVILVVLYLLHAWSTDRFGRVLLTLGCHNEDENEEPPLELNGKSPPQPNEQASVESLALTLTLDVVDDHCRLAYDDAGTVCHVPLALPTPSLSICT